MGIKLFSRRNTYWRTHGGAPVITYLLTTFSNKLSRVTAAVDNKQSPGLAIHEMGTARMGIAPETSVLNRWDQLHSVKDVFVTERASMASSACRNPSLTYMAFNARAVSYAVRQLKAGTL